jgi:beta-mannosidase
VKKINYFMAVIRLALFVAVFVPMILDAQPNASALRRFQPIREAIKATAWEFRQAGTPTWHLTKVPASVHTALLANQLIPDPFYGTNEEQVQWIEREDWEFQTTFDVDEAIFQKEHIELVFKGLDTYAHIYLNDSLLLETDNMFRTWRADTKPFLKPKGNHLHVYFESPMVKTKGDWEALGYELPGGQRTMTRKAQFHYGWDWGPRLVGAGILNLPAFEAWNDFRLLDVFFTPVSITPDEARVVCRFRYESDTDVEVLQTLEHDGRSSIETRLLRAGVHEDTTWFDVANPKLWWCTGMGEPHLYQFSIEFKQTTGRFLDKKTQRTGLRTIELVTEKDEQGSTFFFRLNGRPVFARGANYIPQDLFQDRVTPEKYHQIIDDALAANMNMLRVWGGGIYEDDLFYQLCDEKGLLVWQDFMYACAMYPGNGRFVKNAAAEALEQIERLRPHPSIALWCGNNENDEAWHNWGWQMKFSEAQRNQLWRDYKTLFRDILGTYVQNYAGNVPYWESSPSYSRYNPKSLTEGDNHYWGVWHDEEPFEVFNKKVPRFMSEYGFQSFPEWRTIEAFSKPDERELESKVMLLHQKHPRGNALIAEYTRRDFKAPKRFEDFVYVSQLVQAEGMRTGIEAHRRNKPYCMGTLYWQLNDVWPVASWSSLDSYGRWKALHYYLKGCFSPLAALPILEKDELKVFGVNDLAQDTAVTLQLQLWSFKSKKGEKITLSSVKIPTDKSVLLWQGSLKTLLAGQKAIESVIEIQLLDAAGNALYRRLYYPVSAKDMKLTSPKVSITVNTTAQGTELILSTGELLKNALLQANVPGHFSDNYFDMLPGEQKKVWFKPDQPLEGKTELNFTIKSLGGL